MEILDWLKNFLIALIIVSIIKFFLCDITRIDGDSMNPTLFDNDIIFLNRLSTFFREPKHGEIVVFHAPDINKYYIKRIIGIPGDKVEIYDGKVYLNDLELDETYIDRGVHTLIADDFKWEIQENQYFVLGDNRLPGKSRDSRDFGVIERNSIVNYASARLFPFSKIGSIYK